MTDPIADMLTRIKNAGAVGKPSVAVPYSHFKFEIATLLLREGYVASVSKKNKRGGRTIEIGIAYEDGKPKIHSAKRVSKPSRRVYVRKSSVRAVRQGYGEVVLSTPEGVLSGKDARKKKVGGEVLFEIW